MQGCFFDWHDMFQDKRIGLAAICYLKTCIAANVFLVVSFRSSTFVLTHRGLNLKCMVWSLAPALSAQM